jgi:hypothetical protein
VDYSTFVIALSPEQGRKEFQRSSLVLSRNETRLLKGSEKVAATDNATKPVRNGPPEVTAIVEKERRLHKRRLWYNTHQENYWRGSVLTTKAVYLNPIHRT